MSSRGPSPIRSSFGGFGFGSPPARDLLVLLGVVFVTFAMQFFATTAIVPALMRLTEAVWLGGFVWQLVTYGFAGYGGPSLWFLLELLILYWFGNDVRWRLGRRRFWRVTVGVLLASALVAVAVEVLVRWAAPDAFPAVPFQLIQGQRILMVIFIAAFATAFGDATILLFFIIPVRAGWFLWIELLFGFMAFLSSKDLAGFAGICAAVWFTYLAVNRIGPWRALRDLRLRYERMMIRLRLAWMRRRHGIRVVDGDKHDRWLH